MGKSEAEIIDSLKILYREDPAARKLFDRAAERQRDARSSSIESIMTTCELSRADAVALARKIEGNTECAEFRNGRRGQKTRLVWQYSLISIGKAVSGELDELDATLGNAEELEDAPASTEVPSASSTPTSLLLDAKERLARGLGVPISSIEIIIKA